MTFVRERLEQLEARVGLLERASQGIAATTTISPSLDKEKLKEAILEYFQLHGLPEGSPSVAARVMAEFVADRMKVG